MIRLAPWAYSRSSDPDTEPFPYRAWKRLYQSLTAHRYQPDLLDRIEQTGWDLLIILDACRYDTLVAIADCAVVDRAISPATGTRQFLTAARERGVFDGAVYVSGNPQTDRESPGDLDEYVRSFDSGWDNALGTVPPDLIYQATRERLAEDSTVVAHTIQPHYPHICAIDGQLIPVPGGIHPTELEAPQTGGLQMQALLAGGFVPVSRARRSYRAAVKTAWQLAVREAVSLQSKGYTVVITADHGELFGEHGFYEHPSGVRIKPLVSVPWVVFDGDYESGPAKDQLQALGYVE